MITQLQTNFLPNLKRRSLQRKLRANKLKLQRLVKAKIRKTRSKAKAAMRRQYFLWEAFGDVRKAVALNEDIFITTVIVTLVLSYGYATTTPELMLLFLKTAYAFAEAVGIDILTTTFVCFLVLAALLILSAAFLSNMLAITLMDGITRKKIKSVRLTTRKALHHSGQTTGAWFLVSLLLIIPFIVLAILGFAALSFTSWPLEIIVPTVAPSVAFALGLWTLYILVNYSLVPLIALFESNTPLTETFSRSRELVQRRGKAFLLAGYAVYALALTALYYLALFVENLTGLAMEITFWFGALITTMYAIATLTMFYNKRRRSRKN